MDVRFLRKDKWPELNHVLVNVRTSVENEQKAEGLDSLNVELKG